MGFQSNETPMPKFKLRSLAYETDLSILAFEGVILDRGDYLVAATPSNAAYFWGNLLLMKKPPEAGDCEPWKALFKKEFGHDPNIKHMTFGWDSIQGEEGAAAEFEAEGFEIQRTIVLTAGRDDIRTPKTYNPIAEVRPLISDDDWEMATQNQIACQDDKFDSQKYAAFKRTLMENYRKMSKAGLGRWFGAFLDQRVVADCGLFVFDGIGRYQAVGTHPDHRRRGLCASLIEMTARFAFDKMGARRLVMAADPEYHAARVYESVGFKRTEHQVGMYNWPRDEWGS